MSDMRRIGTHNDILGESPIWNIAEQALYWVDIRAPAIRCLDTLSGRIQSWEMPDLIGSIAFADDGRLIAALPDKLVLFHPKGGRIDTLARLQSQRPGHRFNDGRCDPAGRLWAGTMHNLTRAPEGTLFCYDPAHGLKAVMEGIAIPNSLAWSPDGRTMYFADSLRHTIYAFAFTPKTGEVGVRRVFAKTTPPAFPDGSAMDCEGFLWNAEFLGSRIVRYAPDGRVDQVIACPVDRPTCCAFGGPDLRTLFITSTCQNMTAAERTAQPLAGALFAIDVDVQGLAEHVVRLGSAVTTAPSVSAKFGSI